MQALLFKEFLKFLERVIHLNIDVLTSKNTTLPNKLRLSAVKSLRTHFSLRQEIIVKSSDCCRSTTAVLVLTIAQSGVASGASPGCSTKELRYDTTNHRARRIQTGNLDLVFNYHVNMEWDLSLTVSLNPYIKLSSTGAERAATAAQVVAPACTCSLFTIWSALVIYCPQYPSSQSASLITGYGTNMRCQMLQQLKDLLYTRPLKNYHTIY